MVQGYNCIIVLAPQGDRWLMCKRRKDPYKGLYNLVGGKIEQGEDGETAAYRELFEETSITRDKIKLELCGGMGRTAKCARRGERR